MEKTTDLLPELRWLLLQHTCNAERPSSFEGGNVVQPQRISHPDASVLRPRGTPLSHAAPKASPQKFKPEGTG